MRYSVLALAAAALFCGSAVADTGWRVTAGAINVNPNDDSSHLTNVEAAAGLPSNSTKVKVDDDTQLGLTLNYDFAPNWSVELLAATPFSHEITLSSPGTAVDGLNVGKTKQLPPTVTLQYRFLDGEKIRPYIGVGVNYTKFFDSHVSGQMSSTLDSLGLTGDKDITLSDSFGLAGEVGMDWSITDKAFVRAAVWYADIDTDARVKVNGQTVQKVDVQIDPVVAYIAFGYRF
ncbi:OmpW/AlkL family protein [Gallaecimonas mangrovi]|uniref:OmpW/AlkL family protein n=1 Tax=Gallaecimonas mangrovi TaxID=2291597 RepID=UPI000E1FB5AD|nr:OmpW family outer membrane protein [Gallaecimonas mangrovi]